MKNNILSLLIISSCVACSTSGTKSSFFSLGNSVQPVQLRTHKEVVLKNGLKVYFIQDQSLPRVSLNLLIKTGLFQETVPGQNYMTSQLLEEGTQKKNAMQIADGFGNLGTSLNVSPGVDFTVISSDALSSSADELLNLFVEVIQKPSFHESEMERLRSQVLAQITKKKDNPSGVAEDYFEENIFGGHPYARDVLGTEASIKALRKKDIIQHYLNWYRPNNSELAVVGNITEDFEKSVQTQFENWGRRNLPATPKAGSASPDGKAVVAYLKPNLAQTQIRMGYKGITRNNPDYLTVRLTNEILGGSFGSRLNQKVRDDLGLTYSIYSSIDARLEPGSMQISTFTKNETVEKTISESKKVFEDFAKSGPTGREIEAAKNQLIGQFPRAIETADRYAFNLLALSFYGIPKSYLTDFNQNVNRISKDDIQRVLKQYFKPENMKVIIYGDQKIESQISALNPQINKL